MSHQALSGEQFHAKLTDPEGWGGYSANPHTGAEPSSGFMVSRYGHEDVVEGTAQPEHIDAYLGKHGAHFGPEDFHGGWMDSGKTFLDESVNLPSRREAMDFGRDNAQVAVYDVGTGKAPVVPANPQNKIKGTMFEGLDKTARNTLGVSNRTAQRGNKANELEAEAKYGRSIPDRSNSSRTRQSTIPGGVNWSNY